MGLGDGSSTRGPDPGYGTEEHLRATDRFVDVLLGDASWLDTIRTRLHVRRCSACRRAWDQAVVDLDCFVGPRGAADPLRGVMDRGGDPSDADADASARVRARLLTRVDVMAPRRRAQHGPGFVVGLVCGAALLLAGHALTGRVGAPVATSPVTTSAGPAADWKPTEVAALSSVRGPAQGAVLVDAAARGVTIEVWHLPRLPVGDVYEVWWVTKTGREPAGTFAVDQSGDGVSTVSLPAGLQAVRSVGITREPLPGTKRPTAPRVVGGRVHVRALAGALRQIRHVRHVKGPASGGPKSSGKPSAR